MTYWRSRTITPQEQAAADWWATDDPAFLATFTDISIKLREQQAMNHNPEQFYIYERFDSPGGSQ